jgi:Xaa-Pro dipeptidase
MMSIQRIQQLTELARKRNVDGVAVMPGANMLYLTGLSFHLMERPTVMFFPTQGKPAFVLPSFEAAKPTSGPVAIDWQLFPWTDEQGPERAFAAASKALGLAGKTLAVEELVMRVRELRLIKANAPGARFSDAGPLVSSLRMRKDETEIAQMRKAVAITEAALEATLHKVHAGVTVREITSELRIEMLRGGAEALPFEPIVLSGPDTASPHGAAGERRVQSGDLLLFDFGVSAGGYVSDITRTFAVGQVSDELRRVYDVVKRANEAGRQAARPGVEIQEVDRAARQVLADAGYGQYFTHRTGHGLGLDTHEPPYACEGDTTLLEPGMTFTVEPGVYLPGQGGVRVEDDVVITPGGSESLTTFDRELRVIESGASHG